MGLVARTDGEISGIYLWGQKEKGVVFSYPNWHVPKFQEACRVIWGAMVSISHSSGYALILEGGKSSHSYRSK